MTSIQLEYGRINEYFKRLKVLLSSVSFPTPYDEVLDLQVLFHLNNSTFGWSIQASNNRIFVSDALHEVQFNVYYTCRITMPLTLAIQLINAQISVLQLLNHPQVITMGNSDIFQPLARTAYQCAADVGMNVVLGTPQIPSIVPLIDETLLQPNLLFSLNSDIPNFDLEIPPPMSQAEDMFKDVLSQQAQPVQLPPHEELASSSTSQSKESVVKNNNSDLRVKREHKRVASSSTKEVKENPKEKKHIPPAELYNKKVKEEETTMFSACIACRNSRVRCDYDGKAPCSRCERLSLHCESAPTQRRRRRKLVSNAKKKPPRKPRRAACASCKHSKVKCEIENGQTDCKRCIRLNLPCVKLKSTPGRPLARRTRALKIPAYAPPDLTTFPGIIVPNRDAAREHVEGAYPILALDELIRSARENETISQRGSGGRVNMDSSEQIAPPMSDIDFRSTNSSKVFQWWCRALLLLSIEERSKSEFKACLKIASDLGMNLDNLIQSIHGESFEELKRTPSDYKIKRNEDHSFQQSYVRPAFPKQAAFMEEIASSPDPTVATITMACRNGKRTGTCNVGFAELFLTNRTLDGFTMNGLARPWYDLIVPEDIRSFFEAGMLRASSEESLNEPDADICYGFMDDRSTIVRDKNDLQWRAKLSFRFHLGAAGNVCDFTFGLNQLKVIPKTEYIKWPSDLEKHARNYPFVRLMEPTTPESWNEQDEYYWEQGAASVHAKQVKQQVKKQHPPTIQEIPIKQEFKTNEKQLSEPLGLDNIDFGTFDTSFDELLNGNGNDF